MEVPNPLQIPELLRLCVARVPDASDLRACSLVSRSWVDAAQSSLFREVNLARAKRRWENCHQILEASPHLILHIRRLIAKPVSIETLSAICSFPFSHLEDVDIALTMSIDLQAALHLQQLMALPTIRRVQLSSFFVESPAIFLHIWERASPRLRHLELFCRGFDDVPIPYRHPRIRLESLCLLDPTTAPNWIATILSPFDLSDLIVLSVNDAESLQHGAIVEGLPTLQFLQFPAADNHHPGKPVNLALFPQLEGLRISMLPFDGEGVAMTLATLSSIRPASRIRNITIHTHTPPVPKALCEDLDLALSRLPLPHPYTVTHEMPQFNDEERQLYFPRLGSSNMLGRGDPKHSWFKDLTTTFD
ncbi:hypothetical protein C8R46DRAFT_1190730 [Mycena filopes]|nr:hypothetical protein C8R46DRAFT_1190730 [Mycena filopes]